LASTAETWWSTVLAEMNSFAAIAALVWPAQISARISRSRRVSPNGSFLAADLGPTGMARTPSARSRCRAGRGQVPLEPLDERRLAHPGLAVEQDQAPLAAPSLGRVAGQQGQRRLALQQLHGTSVGHADGFVPTCDLVGRGIRARLPGI
jgi:hypothetical protein